MAEKVTKMVLTVVDLQCCRCFKKVKKVLCKFPQIRDQIYDVKTKTVTITVVCCNPEKIRDKICCKGGGCITRIEIEQPPSRSTTPPPSRSTTPSPPPPSTPSPPTTPTISPPAGFCCMECYHGHSGGPCYTCRPPPPPGRPSPPVGFCCTECYHGHGGGPCYTSRPPPAPRPCYGSCGRPFCHFWGCTGGYKCCYCSCEENPESCSMM